MAIIASPRTPTARKALTQAASAAAASINSNNDVKEKQQRVSAPSRTALPSKQERMAPASSQQYPSVGINRKIKAEDAPPTTSREVARSVPTATMLSNPKRQNVERNKNAVKATHPQGNAHPLTRSQSPQPTYTMQKVSTSTTALVVSNQLLQAALQQFPALLPANTTDFFTPITSKHIDSVAHSMWQLAFKQGSIMQSICQYSTMFSHLKLAVLAKLNFLPSWWFLREMAIKQMKEVGWNIEDKDMVKVWTQTCDWCVEVRKRADNGGMVGERKVQDGEEEGRNGGNS